MSGEAVFQMAPTVIDFCRCNRWLVSPFTMYIFGLAPAQKRLFINACYHQSGPFHDKNISKCFFFSLLHLLVDTVSINTFVSSGSVKQFSRMKWNRSTTRILYKFYNSRSSSHLIGFIMETKYTLITMSAARKNKTQRQIRLIHGKAIKCSQWCVSFGFVCRCFSCTSN